MIGNVTLIQLLFLGLLPLVLFAWFGLVGVLALKRRWIWAAALFSPALLAPLWLWIMVYHPFGPVGRLRVLDQAELTNGARLMLTQSRNEDWREPYAIHFWIKPPGTSWGCLPIDLESSWWRSGSVQTSGTQATIFNGRQWELDLFINGKTYQAAEDEEPQEPVWMEAGWEPRQGGEYRDALDRAYGRKYVPPKRVAATSDQQTTPTDSNPTGNNHEQ